MKRIGEGSDKDKELNDASEMVEVDFFVFFIYLLHYIQDQVQVLSTC